MECALRTPPLLPRLMKTLESGWCLAALAVHVVFQIPATELLASTSSIAVCEKDTILVMHIASTGTTLLRAFHSLALEARGPKYCALHMSYTVCASIHRLVSPRVFEGARHVVRTGFSIGDAILQ